MRYFGSIPLIPCSSSNPAGGFSGSIPKVLSASVNTLGFRSRIPSARNSGRGYPVAVTQRSDAFARRLSLAAETVSTPGPCSCPGTHWRTARQTASCNRSRHRPAGVFGQNLSARHKLGAVFLVGCRTCGPALYSPSIAAQLVESW